MMKTAFYLFLQFFAVSLFAQNSLTIKVLETYLNKEKHEFTPGRIFTVVQKNTLQKIFIDTINGKPLYITIKSARIDKNGIQYYGYIIQHHNDTNEAVNYLPYSEIKTRMVTYSEHSSKGDDFGYTIEYVPVCDSSTIKKSNLPFSTKEVDFTLKINNTKVKYKGKEVKAKWPTVFATITGTWSDTVYSKITKSKEKLPYQIGMTYKVEKYYVNGVEQYDLLIDCIKKDINGITSLIQMDLFNLEYQSTKKTFSSENSTCKVEIENFIFQPKKKKHDPKLV